MKHIHGFSALAASVLTLVACGGGDGNNSQVPVQVDDLAAGSYVVSVGDMNAPTVGKYYAAADGSRLLVLADSRDHARQLYRRDTDKPWVRVPASDTPTHVRLLHSNVVPTTAVDMAALAGTYITQAGTVTSFTVTANGRIIAGTSTCQLSGQLSASPLPGALKLRLSTTACGSLPADSTGVLVVDADYAPASFRLIADNGTQVLDLWAYKE